MSTRLFKIDKRPTLPKGWGDDGDILHYGMASHWPKLGGRCALERTGPAGNVPNRAPSPANSAPTAVER